MTRLVGRLEDRGLLRRDPDPDDARAFRATLTPDGGQKLAQARITHDAVLARIISPHLTAGDRRAPGAAGLLVVQPRHGNGLMLVSADGSRPQRLCSNRGCVLAHDPTWSADGREIVYRSDSGLDAIYADGSCLICGLRGGFTGAGFTAAGELLVTQGKTVGTLGVDGLGFRRLLRGRAGVAVWSARGRVALVRTVRRRSEVFVTDTNGHHLRQLTRIGASSPSWGPDGRLLAVAHAGSVVLIDLHGRSVRRLARGGSPAFAPDGRNVAYIGTHGHVNVISVRGGRPHPVGSVRGKHVDWQPLPSGSPAPCQAPGGSQIVASSPDAIATSRSDTGGPRHAHARYRNRTAGHLAWLSQPQNRGRRSDLDPRRAANVCDAAPLIPAVDRIVRG